MAKSRPLANPVDRSVILRRGALIVAVVLAGCAAPPGRSPDLMPPIQLSDETWRQVEWDIVGASRAAAGPAANFARGSMESWRDRLRQRTEGDFIPWYTSYLTQQWLAIKVVWYKLGSDDDKTSLAVNRLAAYLQEQYQNRVLNPVTREIDPDRVREQATRLYLQLLGAQLQALPLRYGVPVDQFDRRLKGIPAIALAPPPAHSASLHEIVHADQMARLPACVALNDQIHKAAGSAAAGPLNSRISPMAKQASEKLMAKLATSGGASAAAAVVGGVAGIVISLGAAGWSAMAHENERLAMEAQLRESLNVSLDDMWLVLMENPATGVMAGVYHISAQIEGALAGPLAPAIKFEPIVQEIPLSNEQSIPDEENEDLIDDGGTDD